MSAYQVQNQNPQFIPAIVGLCVIVSLTGCSVGPASDSWDTRTTFKGTTCSATFHQGSAADSFFSWNKRQDGLTTGFSLNLPFSVQDKDNEPIENPCRRIIDAASEAAEIEKKIVELELKVKEFHAEETKAEANVNLLDLLDQLETMKDAVDFEFQELD